MAGEDKTVTRAQRLLSAAVEAVVTPFILLGMVLVFAVAVVIFGFTDYVGWEGGRYRS
jgi:hypothetical protein